MEKKGLRYCDKCKSLLVEHESWFVEIASEHLCVCCAENEIVGLRDQLRWRIWPEEKPVTSGRYLVLTDGSTDVGDHVSYYSMSAGWATKDAGIAFWRPVGPLPGGE